MQSPKKRKRKIYSYTQLPEEHADAIAKARERDVSLAELICAQLRNLPRLKP